MHFTELEKFGWNWLTASFLCIAIITTWQYRAFSLQARRIWEHRSSKTVSVTMTTSVFFIMATSLVYGLITRMLVITYTGGLAAPAFFTMLGAWRFGNPTLKDKAVFGGCLAGILLFLLPVNPAWVFSGFMVVGMLPFVDQIRELLANKARGDLHGEFLLTLVVKNSLLTLFAFLAKEPVYMIFLPLYLVLTLWQLLLWWKYESV